MMILNINIFSLHETITIVGIAKCNKTKSNTA